MLCETTPTPVVVEIPTVLPGRLTLCLGGRDAYESLARFHYRPKPPATFASVIHIRYQPHSGLGTQDCGLSTVAVAVLSYPTVALHVRDRLLDLTRMSPGPRLRWVNRNVRCISRVVVHPTFRSLGLATLLVRHVLANAPTRYTEALAVMARAHPFFERAGMTRHDPACPAAPVYYLHDRHATALQNEPNLTPTVSA